MKVPYQNFHLDISRGLPKARAELDFECQMSHCHAKWCANKGETFSGHLSIVKKGAGKKEFAIYSLLVDNAECTTG